MPGIIEVQDKQNKTSVNHMIEARPVLIGRSPACDIVLDAVEVSRRHCMFESRSGQFWVVDLASANGTFINSVQVKEKKLEDGDILTIGKNSRWQVRFSASGISHAEETKVPKEVFSDDTTQKATIEKPITQSRAFLDDTPSEHTVTGKNRDTTAYRSQNQLNILFRIGRIMMSSLDLERLLELMMEEIMSILPGDRGCVVFAEDQPGSEHPALTIKAYKQRSSIPKALHPELHLSRTIVRRAMNQQMALLLTDLDTDSEFHTTDTIIKRGIRSSICAPIKGKDRMLGVIYLDSQSGSDTFTEKDLDLLTAIANQAGIAVENALLWEKMRRYSEELEQEVSQRTAEIAFERNRLRAILQCMGEGIVVSDPQDQVNLMNPAAERILNVKPEDTLSGDILSWYPQEVHSVAIQLLNRVKNVLSPETLSEELRVMVGNKHVRLNLAPIRDEQDKYLGMVIANQDITKEVEVEQMKADFISMLTHDLKNPLTVIISSSQLIIKGYLGPIDLKTEDQIKAIYRNGQTMLELVNNFLDVSKIEAGRMSIGKHPLSIADLIDNVVQNFQMQATELGIDLIKEVDRNLPVITGDPFQMERVLSNLVSNAIKFTSRPGMVIVKTKVVSDYLQISVSDSGQGIPKDELPHLFNRYFRTKNVEGKVKGTGLGLYIVKSIVEAHNGKVEVQSEAGKGTTFDIILPSASSP